MPYVVIRDDPHALTHRILPCHRNHRARHNLAYRRLFRQPALQNHLARIVALRNNPDQHARLHHQQRSHLPRRHYLNRLVDRRVWPYGSNHSALLLQHHGNRRLKITHRPPRASNTTSVAQPCAIPFLSNSGTSSIIKPRSPSPPSSAKLKPPTATSAQARFSAFAWRCWAASALASMTPKAS